MNNSYLFASQNHFSYLGYVFCPIEIMTDDIELVLHKKSDFEKPITKSFSSLLYFCMKSIIYNKKKINLITNLYIKSTMQRNKYCLRKLVNFIITIYICNF